MAEPRSNAMPRPVRKSVAGGPSIEVRSKAPFAVAVVLWRDESSRVLATIVAKSTYGLAQGRSEIVDPPDPIRYSDEHWEGGPARTLRFPSDVAPFKAGHEVLVVGRVQARGSRAARSAPLRLIVGEVEKAIEATEPGEHHHGPGFGPVSRSWPLRGSLLSPEEREWLVDPVGGPRPRGFDPWYFCAAPSDQRSADPFSADARLILEGIHPEHARLVTNLAGIVPALRSVGPSLALPPFVADTLTIDVERQIANMTFRAIVPLETTALVVDVVARGYGDDRSALGGEATTELEGSSLRDEQNALAGEGTTELASSWFADGAPNALPFRSSPAASSSPPSPPPPPALPRPRPMSAPPLPKVRQPGPLGAGEDPFRKAFGLAEPVVSEPADPPRAPPSAPNTSPDKKADSPKGARAASDAAAVMSELRSRATGASGREPTAIAVRRAIVDLIAFDPCVPSRLHRSKTHAPLLAVPPPPRAHQKVDVPVVEPTSEQRARHDVLRVLSCGTPLGPEALRVSVDALFDDPHDFEIPLLLVQGEVRPTMDEVETLRVATELAKPMAGNNKQVLTAIAVANEALSRSSPPLPEAATTLYKRLEATMQEQSLPSRYLSDLVDRTLCEGRSFKKRTLLGAPRIRAELALGGLSLPVYLPEAAAPHLPLLPVFTLSALVEFRPREDASEPNPAALVAFALGRVLRTQKE